MVLKFWVAYTRAPSDLRTRIERGATPLQKSGLAGNFFSWTGIVTAARIGWIEVGCLSVRIAGVSGVGIGRGKIVDCRGCLDCFRL